VIGEDKPVVVSMGSVAASGGYYVSAPATAIIAHPSTITGSIGVYSGKFSAAELFNRIGLNVEQYTRGRNAAMYSMATPMDDHEFATMDRMTEHTYTVFKSRVEQGRNLDPEDVEAIAQGRVWSGTAAVNNGLVDALGGFNDAVQRARLEAEIPPTASVELTYYLDNGDTFQALSKASLQQLISNHSTPLLPPRLQVLSQYALLSQEDIWAIMPYHLEVR